MTGKAKIRGTEEAWDKRELGASAEHAVAVSEERHAELEEALGKRMISIRLDVSLIEDFKMISEYHGMGYQPLMRQALKRWADAELRAILAGQVKSERERAERRECGEGDCDSKPASRRRAA